MDSRIAEKLRRATIRAVNCTPNMAPVATWWLMAWDKLARGETRRSTVRADGPCTEIEVIELVTGGES